MADPTHSTGYEPKEFDKFTSADGDTTPINDSNYDNISDFSKITLENTGLFGVSTMLEASVSFVSLGESVARQRERKKRFRDQCCRVDVEEVDGTVLGVILFRLTENYILMNEISEKTQNEELNKPFFVKIQLRENYI